MGLMITPDKHEKNPILSFCDKVSGMELLTMAAVDINSFTDVGIYAGVSPHATLKLWSLN